ncbi:translation initiation factor IF-2 N-terminal domain-containing protein [Streptomyces sp. NBC_01390]|uniref:translation initiation factor IF-2 N-terminal domain-containing protein n=1 Tax=Streptomyces sp. NBC_01390 TaxID=2903850 RepID=UPI0032529130
MNPIGQLLEGKHESSDVQALVRRFLDPIVNGIAYSKYAGAQMIQGKRLLEALLIDVMKRSLSPDSPEFRIRAAEIAYQYRDYLRVDYESTDGSSFSLPWSWEQWRQDLVRRIVAGDPQPLHDSQVYARIKQDLDMKLREHLISSELALWRYSRRETLLREHAEKVHPFLRNLCDLCELLAAEPVYTSVPGHSGRPAQTYADAQAELSNAIKGLPNYFAFVRLRTDPVQVSRVRLSPPGNPFRDELESDEHREEVIWRAIHLRGSSTLVIAADGSLSWGDSEEREERRKRWEERDFRSLKDRSSEEFGTPRETVDAEIRDRRARLFGQHGPESPVSAKKSASLPVDLAQATARAKWQREHPKTPETSSRQPPVHEQSDGSSSRHPSIGRRSPKRRDAAPQQQVEEAGKRRQPLGGADMPRASRPSVASALERLSSRGNMRICEFAEELGVESQVVLDELDNLGLFVRSPDSTLKASAVHKLIVAFRKHPKS